MPYMTRPSSGVPVWYGPRQVQESEIVLVSDHDVASLIAEGWTLEPQNTTATKPFLAIDEEVTNGRDQ